MLFFQNFDNYRYIIHNIVKNYENYTEVTRIFSNPGYIICNTG